jgi:hypothetical protein
VGQGKWQVSTSGGREPAWARSGRELFFLGPDGALMAMAVDVPQSTAGFPVRTPVKILDDAQYYSSGGVNLGRTYDVSPDGARFVRIKEQDAGVPSSIIVIQNWFEELERLVPIN